MRHTIRKTAMAFAFAGMLVQPSFAQDSIPLGKGAGGEQLTYAIESTSAMVYTARTVLTLPTPQTVADIRNVVDAYPNRKLKLLA